MKSNLPRFQQPAADNERKFLFAVCVSAILLRVCAIPLFGAYKVVSDDTGYFGFGWEMGRVAASLATGHGFSSPLPLPTGPTAMVGPVYPLILAAIFKVLGVYSTKASIAARVLQCIITGLTCWPVYLCGRDTGSKLIGRLASIGWAIFPLNIFFAVERVWETSLTSLFVALVFWCMFKCCQSQSLLRWSANGLLLGVAALTSTSLVMLSIPFCVVAMWKFRAKVVRPLLLFSLTFGLTISPWLARNYIVFNKVMMRSNFPLEFRIGNNPLSYGQKAEALHPSNTPSLNKRWQEIGEIRFMEEDRKMNAQFIRENRGRFMFSTANRIVNYWTAAWIKTIPGYPNNLGLILGTSLLTLTGLFGLWHQIAKQTLTGWLFAGCLILYPIVYCITTTQPRFYNAITPLLMPLCATALLTCREWLMEKRFLGAPEMSSAKQASE